MRRFLKVKVLEKYKIDKNKFYLLYREYKNLSLEEYVVCENYNFRVNVYSNGILFDSKELNTAYYYYNMLVNLKSFDKLKKVIEKEKKGQEKVDNIN